jgi:pilus assembly protein CpaB
MTYRLRNIVIAVVLAVLAALLTMMYVTSFERRVQSGESKINVLVAKTEIPAGTAGSKAAQLVEEQSVAQRNVAPGAVTDRSALKDLVVTEPIYGGEQITRQRFGSSTEIGVRSELKGNMRAVSVPGDQFQLLAGTLRSGDHVDVVASLKISADKDIHATRIVLRDILVLKAPPTPSGTEHIGASAGNGGPSVLLAVSDTQVQKLFHVTKHGDWTLELRPVVDGVDSPEAIETVASLMRDGLRRKAGGN